MKDKENKKKMNEEKKGQILKEKAKTKNKKIEGIKKITM